jgi:hypothetical protein
MLLNPEISACNDYYLRQDKYIQLSISDRGSSISIGICLA